MKPADQPDLHFQAMPLTYSLTLDMSTTPHRPFPS